jgi:hypothetical protein
MRALITTLCLLLPNIGLAGNCRLDALQSDVVIPVHATVVHSLERTLQFRASCSRETEARISVSTQHGGLAELRGRTSGALSARVYINGQEATGPIDLFVNKDGRVIEVRVVVEGGGLLPRADTYSWIMETVLDY